MPNHPTTKTAERPRGNPTPSNGAIQVAQHTEIFEGPLPPPGILKQYDEVQPGFAERLMRLTEDEAVHRRTVTVRAQRNEFLETFIGQVFGLIVALAAFCTAGYLGFLGHPTAAAAVGGTTIAGLVGVFVAGRQRPGEPK